jgi:poly(3-hydroxybutyrate) depolymerase
MISFSGSAANAVGAPSATRQTTQLATPRPKSRPVRAISASRFSLAPKEVANPGWSVKGFLDFVATKIGAFPAVFAHFRRDPPLPADFRLHKLPLLVIEIGANSGEFMSLPSPADGAAPITTRAKDGFSYCVHLPSPCRARPRLLVVLHGSDYQHEAMCRFFASFADEANAIVLAPLFRKVGGAEDLEGFKFLRSPHGEYDRLLLAMVDEVAHEYGVADSRFAMFGFSGGAQFAHRFYYVHPQRLHAVSIAAPGMVTLLDDTQGGWIGTKDLRAQFGYGVDLAALRAVPVQLLVGAADSVPHTGDAGQAAYDYAGRHRVERLRNLARNYEAAGIAVSLREVDGVAHEFERLGEASLPFLRSQFARLDRSA